MKTMLIGYLSNYDETYLICVGFDRDKIQKRLNEELEKDRLSYIKLWKGRPSSIIPDFATNMVIEEIEMLE